MNRVLKKSPNSRFPILVAIVGGSGSGKSWLADRLQQALGDDASRLSLDDFYRDRSHLPPARRAELNFDHPLAIDWAALETTLRQCAQGRQASVPVYDFHTHTRAARPRDFTPGRLVLFDGLWLLRRPSVRRFFDYSIFLDCPAPLRLSRRLARDCAERGRSRASVARQFATTVEPMHVKYVEGQRKWADRVLSNEAGNGTLDALVKVLSHRLAREEKNL